MNEKYRVHGLARFHYSEIGEYIDEYHTDRPLRNDEIIDLLNKLSEENKLLKEENKELRQDNDIKFWKLKCIHYFNANSVFMSEISRAMKKGYIISEHFQKFLNDVKEHNEEVKEKNKRLFGDSK